MAEYRLDLGAVERGILIKILEEDHRQQLAWIAARHSTDAERQQSQQRALVARTVLEYLR